MIHTTINNKNHLAVLSVYLYLEKTSMQMQGCLNSVYSCNLEAMISLTLSDKSIDVIFLNSANGIGL